MSLLRFVTHGLPHYTPDYTPHQPLHFLLSNQRLYKYPGLPVTPRRPFSDFVRRCIDPCLDLGLLLSRRPYTCLPLSDPACLTMSMSNPVNKSMQMDPLASRLSLNVTEYSATKGSSSFSPRHSSGMDTNRILFGLKQGPRTLEQHIIEFLAIANHSDLPDCILIEIFCDGLNELLKARLRREGPRSSLAVFLDFALLCEGSSFTVGVADGERDDVVMAAAHPAARWRPRRARRYGHVCRLIAREMAAVSERARAMAATAEPVHKMAAKTELRHVTAAMPEPSHAAAVFPESSQVSKPSQAGAAFPAPSQVSAALSKASEIKTVFPVSSQVRAVDTMSSQVTVVASVSSQITAINPEPEPLHKMAATPEPLHKMAATPEPLHKMAATPEPLHKMAATPEPLHKMAATPEPLHKMAATPEPLHKMAAQDGCHARATAQDGCHARATAQDGRYVKAC
ncbi:Foot protein 1 variant 1 [Labeo rohita]|uniref:Foot protein 1 variant 1 n=1 Tax=Labeo rohita TaxID=84645 RepID=A0ABQ8MRS3_LABRO|nr:Foot protein 1 variant 1 [Labeo rohita]